MVMVESVSSCDVSVIRCAVEEREDVSCSSSESASHVISSSSFCVVAPKKLSRSV
jgi:hypothetical protein